MRISIRVKSCTLCPFLKKPLVSRAYCYKQPDIVINYKWVPEDCKYRGKYIDNGPVEILEEI
jgi:hypothetical protein